MSRTIHEPHCARIASNGREECNCNWVILPELHTRIVSTLMIALLAFSMGFAVALLLAERDIDAAHAVVKAHCGTE